MEFDLKSLIIGSVFGAFLTSCGWLALQGLEPGPIKLDLSIAKLIISEARAECATKDRPFRIEGAGAYVTAGCGG